jgi:hypothetical protein
LPDIYPNIRRANWTAISIFNKPYELTRCSECKQGNRDDIRRRLTALRRGNEVPTIDQVHEYPYAATEEGGVGAYFEVVPGNENSQEGGDFLRWLDSHNVRNHCKFQVLPILGGTQR